MKRFKKKAVMALLAANGVTDFAASSSKAATGYGTLYGRLTTTGTGREW